MPHRLMWLIALLSLLTGCFAAPHVATAPAGPASSDTVLSDQQLHSDDLKHLPTDSETARIDPLGDLLETLSQLDPKNPELLWFQRLSRKMRQEVITELNGYHLVLRDKLLVKSRLQGDDYAMRWRFADLAPTHLAVESPSLLTGKSRSVQVAMQDFHTTRMPPVTNDRRSFNAHIKWQPNPSANWSDKDELSQEVAEFTLPIHYSADCEIINRVPQSQERLGPMQSLELLPDGSVRMTVSETPLDGDSLTIRMALNGTGEAASVIAKPGDSIAVIIVDALGAGASGYTYLGARDGKLRFESRSWFYEIVPAMREIIEVPPYRDPIEEKAPAPRNAG